VKSYTCCSWVQLSVKSGSDQKLLMVLPNQYSKFAYMKVRWNEPRPGNDVLLETVAWAGFYRGEPAVKMSIDDQLWMFFSRTEGVFHWLADCTNYTGGRFHKKVIFPCIRDPTSLCKIFGNKLLQGVSYTRENRVNLQDQITQLGLESWLGSLPNFVNHFTHLTIFATQNVKVSTNSRTASVPLNPFGVLVFRP